MWNRFLNIQCKPSGTARVARKPLQQLHHMCSKKRKYETFKCTNNSIFFKHIIFNSYKSSYRFEYRSIVNAVPQWQNFRRFWLQKKNCHTYFCYKVAVLAYQHVVPKSTFDNVHWHMKRSNSALKCSLFKTDLKLQPLYC